MKKLEKFINLLQEVILEIDKEKANPNTIWKNSVLDNVVKNEIIELLKYAQKGKDYLKQIGSHIMPETTYYITDELCSIGKTPLGVKIDELKQLYKKL